MSILNNFKEINPEIEHIEPTTFENCILKEIIKSNSSDNTSILEKKRKHPFYFKVKDINIQQKIYDFDRIAELLHNKKFTSTDCIIEHNKTILLIEFKSGFYDKISAKTFLPEYNKCPNDPTNQACEDYLTTYCNKRTLEKKELINSIRLKALESYLTLHYASDISPYKIKLLVIIDGTPEDNYENSLNELASVSTTPNTNVVPKPIKELSEFNPISKTKSQLTPYKKFCFVGQERQSRKQYLYDDIKVTNVDSLQSSIYELLK